MFIIEFCNRGFVIDFAKIQPLEHFIAPLKGGLPSRDPQILKSLILSVCCPIFSRDLPSGICTGYKRRFHRVYFSRVPKPDPPFRRLTPGWTLQRGPIFFDIFSIFVHSKCACSDDLLNEIEIVISPAICWLLGSEAPLSGGQTAPRVQTSTDLLLCGAS